MDEKKLQAEELHRLLGEKKTIKIGGKAMFINEPTLAVLDKMSLEAIKMQSLDIKETDDNIKMIADIRANVVKNARIVAKIIACGILGEKCFRPLGAILLRIKARKVYKSATTGELKEASEVLTATSGLTDFFLTTKLLSTATTTTTVKQE